MRSSHHKDSIFQINLLKERPEKFDIVACFLVVVFVLITEFYIFLKI